MFRKYWKIAGAVAVGTLLGYMARLYLLGLAYEEMDEFVLTGLATLMLFFPLALGAIAGTLIKKQGGKEREAMLVPGGAALAAGLAIAAFYILFVLPTITEYLEFEYEMFVGLDDTLTQGQYITGAVGAELQGLISEGAANFGMAMVGGFVGFTLLPRLRGAKDG